MKTKVTRNIMISKSDAKLSDTNLNYRIALPVSWMKELKIVPEDRSVVLEFDGETITIKREKN